MQEKKLEKYCKKMLLPYEIMEGVLTLDNKNYLILEDVRIFDEDMNFVPDTEFPIEEEEDYDGYVYQFGGRWYTRLKGESIVLRELKYVGEAISTLPTESFLGIRTGYELHNGIGLHDVWMQKAKFLGCKNLGMCERSTLSGALLFQEACKANGIHPIIGMTIPVQGLKRFDIKLYAKNFEGWINLLKISAILNVNHESSIEKSFLENNSEGCFVVVDPKSMDFEDMPKTVDFYQLETVTFLNEDKDKWFIDNLEKFIRSEYQPISITDAFYLEKDEYITREYLWAVAKAFDDKTNNQYFKSKGEYVLELLSFFEKGDVSWVELFRTAIKNESFLAENCSFKYDTDTRHLPKYKMSEEEELDFDTNEELFIHLIKEGFKKRGITEQRYIDRVQEEIRVLKKGDVIDYFLVLHDIIKYAKSNSLLTGIGRGSAGGSLVAYLLGIIQIDPIEFDLLFERFLNSGRMGIMEERPYYVFEGKDGEEIGLAEGSVLKIIRDGRERVVRVEDIEEGDDILKY